MFKVTWMCDDGAVETLFAESAPEKGTVEEYEVTTLHSKQVVNVVELPEPEPALTSVEGSVDPTTEPVPPEPAPDAPPTADPANPTSTVTY